VSAAASAFVGGFAGALAFGEISAWALCVCASHVPVTLRAVVRTLMLAGAEGRDPGAAERRRLLAVGAGAAFCLGLLAAGPLLGAALGAGTPWLVSRALRARRERYRQRVDDGAAAMALAVADALGGGHSLRGALGEAAVGGGVYGAAGRELERVAGELALGARTDDALEALRGRVRSHRVDTLVAACLLQRRTGGDLARLLRDCAAAFEDQARLDGEVRAATAQARFTGVVVVLLPLGGALLAELASPGYLRGLAGSFLTLWLGGLALAMQAAAAVLIRRLARVKE
jgi:tight adherence protein B